MDQENLIRNLFSIEEAIECRLFVLQIWVRDDELARRWNRIKNLTVRQTKNLPPLTALVAAIKFHL